MLTRMSFTTLTVLVMPCAFGAAHAGAIERTSCVGRYDAFSCSTVWGEAGDPYIRTVLGPRSAQEEAEFIERDHKWMARCHPVITQDHYGINRYHYAASGCEFGVINVDIMRH
jgi:hypothetical protein